MGRETSLSDVHRWISANPLKDRLKSIDPLTLPDLSQRALPDTRPPEHTFHPDFISEEQLAYSLHTRRNDLALLTHLSVTEAGARNASEVMEFLKSMDLSGEASFDRSAINLILRQLTEAGAIEKEGSGHSICYSRNSVSDTDRAQSGHLFDLSKKYDVPLQMLTGAGTPRQLILPDDEFQGADIGYIRDRVRIARMIQKARITHGAKGDLQIRQTDIAQALGKSSHTAKDHLKQMARAGLITYNTADTAQGSFAFYEAREVKPSEGQTVLALLRQYISQADGPITAEEGADFVIANDPRYKDASDHQERMLKIYTGGLLRRMANDGEVARVGPFSRDKKSAIHLTVNQDQNQVALLRDFVITLCDVQLEDAQTEKRGVKLAGQIVTDKPGVTTILSKIRRHNEENYSPRRLRRKMDR